MVAEWTTSNPKPHNSRKSHIFWHFKNILLGKTWSKCVVQLSNILSSQMFTCVTCQTRNPGALWEYGAQARPQPHLRNVFICSNFSTVRVQMSSEITCLPHWLHFFYFSPLCVFKCALKLLVFEDA